MVSSNALIGVLPALVTTVAAARASGDRLVAAVPGGGVFALLAIYVFDLSNQITGVPEDRINKPARPLVTGLLTLRGAWIRLAAATALLLLTGQLLGIIHLALLWAVVTGANNHLGLARRPLCKPLVVGVQAGIQLLSAWHIGGGRTGRFLPCAVVLSVLLALLMPLQDLRDIKGDRAVGRRTLPIAYGARPVRFYLCGALLLTPVAVRRLVGLGVLWPGGWLEVLAAGLCACAAVRVVVRRSAASDERTYRLLVLWYAAMAAGPLAAML
ncbi:UbiA family prenyltransferase [Streptomyces sp. NPDC002952]|uniref:UbiA family prenyltransferase n=1 Tax=Streptomyces sp. NPDC002952 TaxID=3364673 RepID=UPI0036A3B5E2